MDYEVPTEKDYEKAAKIGVSKGTVYQRVYAYGWSIERAISTPISFRKSKMKSLGLLAEKNGISKSTFFRRVKEGMGLLEAASIPTCKYKEYQKLCEENGIKPATFYQRVNRGMNPHEAATKPLNQKRVRKETITKTVEKKSSKYSKLIEIASKNGIGYKTFYSRIGYGWDLLEAATKPLEKRGRKKKQIS